MSRSTAVSSEWLSPRGGHREVLMWSFSIVETVKATPGAWCGDSSAVPVRSLCLLDEFRQAFRVAPPPWVIPWR